MQFALLQKRPEEQKRVRRFCLAKGERSRGEASLNDPFIQHVKMLKQSSSEEKQVSSKTLKMFFDSESVRASIHKTEIRSCTTETQASDLS